MFPLKLSAALLLTAAGPVARVTDLTKWDDVPGGRAAWAVLLTGDRVGSVSAQDTDLNPFSYEPHFFASGTQPSGTVDVPLEGDNVYRLRAVPVPVVEDSVGLDTATAGRLYFQQDFAQFYYKTPTGGTRLVESWADVLGAALTDVDTAGTGLLERGSDAYVLSDTVLREALARLNLAYLEGGPRSRQVLVDQYIQGELLVEGARRQFERAYYADAATALLAAERLLGVDITARLSLPAYSL